MDFPCLRVKMHLHLAIFNLLNITEFSANGFCHYRSLVTCVSNSAFQHFELRWARVFLCVAYTDLCTLYEFSNTFDDIVHKDRFDG